MLKLVHIEKSKNKILAHSILINKKKISKGKIILNEDIMLFKSIGIKKVYIFDQSKDYIEENVASFKIAKYISYKHIKINKPVNGRADLFSTINGMLNYDRKKLINLNYLNDDLAAAMMKSEKIVKKNQLIGNVKILPYAISNIKLDKTLKNKSFFNILKIDKPVIKTINLIIASNEENNKLNTKVINSINDRLSKFNLKLKNTLYCKHSTESLIASLKLRIIKNSDLILLYGSTSIVDKKDVLPKSLEKVNGKVISFGAPTDPGNLIMYGKLKNIKVIGVPGCAKSSLRNGFDLMLEKACFDLKINKKIIAEMSCGGLYKNFIKNNHET